MAEVAVPAEMADVAGGKGATGAGESVAAPADAVAAAAGGLVHLRGLRCHTWPIEDAAAAEAAEAALSLMAAE